MDELGFFLGASSSPILKLAMFSVITMTAAARKTQFHLLPLYLKPREPRGRGINQLGR